MLYRIYSLLGTVVYFVLLLLALLRSLFVQKDRFALWQRLGRDPRLRSQEKGVGRHIWLHAASVGEVQAARSLVAKLAARGFNGRYTLTTMTWHGVRVARQQMPEHVRCLLAPLDLPPAVRKAVKAISPDCYVCLETELWPVMLTEIARAGINMVLVNGRMSEKSYGRYRIIHGLMATLLRRFHALAVIREVDGDRFISLGAPPERVVVTGNSKYDLMNKDVRAVRSHYRSLLGLEDSFVFICGSTRQGEEELLVPVYERLAEELDRDVVWIVAPRHLERLAEIKTLFDRIGLAFDLYTEIKEKGRRNQVILVDCMGELVELYAAAEIVFCGGSLVDRGGHNIMEAVRWGRPVYFGPSMHDFHDAVELVRESGAGFQVADAEELSQLLSTHIFDPGKYDKACQAASKVAASQRDAAQMQVDIILEQLSP